MVLYLCLYCKSDGWRLELCALLVLGISGLHNLLDVRLYELAVDVAGWS